MSVDEKIFFRMILEKYLKNPLTLNVLQVTEINNY